MIRSPGAAASIAPWMVPELVTCVGVLFSTVTVTVSIVCFPLAAVIANSPQRVATPPYSACCCLQTGTCTVPPVAVPLGIVPVIVLSDQATLTSGAPPTVTAAQTPVAGQLDGRPPKP